MKIIERVAVESIGWLVVTSDAHEAGLELGSVAGGVTSLIPSDVISNLSSILSPVETYPAC